MGHVLYFHHNWLTIVIILHDTYFSPIKANCKSQTFVATIQLMRKPFVELLEMRTMTMFEIYQLPQVVKECCHEQRQMIFHEAYFSNPFSTTEFSEPSLYGVPFIKSTIPKFRVDIACDVGHAL